MSDKNTDLPTMQQADNKNMVAVTETAIRKAAHLHFHLKFMWVFISIVFITLSFLIIWVVTNSNKTRAAEFGVLTHAKNGWTLKDKGIVARKETYQNFMLNVHRVHGIKYKKGKARTYGMESKEVGVWIDLNWSCSTAFDFNPYIIPIIQIRESSLDPYMPGPSGEIPGLSQMMPNTADDIDDIIEAWDEGRRGQLKQICRAYGLSYDTLITGDPEIYMLNFKYATVGAYVLMRYLADRLDNNMMWYVSCYHWGFLINYYHNGAGILPTYFEVAGREPYSVSGYWCKFGETLETFNEGKLEPSKVIIERWQDEERRISLAERRFIKSIKTIKKMDQAFKNLKKKELERDKAEKHMEYITEKTYKDLQSLIPKIRNFNGKDIRVILNKHKGPVRDWVKAKIKQPMSDVVQWWAIAIVVALAVILVMARGLWAWSKSIANGFSHSRLRAWIRKHGSKK